MIAGSGGPTDRVLGSLDEPTDNDFTRIATR